MKLIQTSQGIYPKQSFRQVVLHEHAGHPSHWEGGAGMVEDAAYVKFKVAAWEDSMRRHITLELSEAEAILLIPWLQEKLAWIARTRAELAAKK